MKTTISGLLAFTFLVSSTAAHSQAETLYYHGAAFTNATMSLPVEGITSAPFSIGESITLAILINAPLADNLAGFAVTPAALTITSPGQMNFLPPGPGTAFSESFAFSTNSIGNITGWSFSIVDGPQLGTNSSVIFTVTSNGSGGKGADSAYASYFSPQYANPNEPPGCCFSSASINVPGSWTVSRAPEIEPASAIGSLTLLLGALAVLRGGRRMPLIAS